ncbi:hypothetical protein CCP1ISM_2200002 [Azospirillaceae bacterium]
MKTHLTMSAANTDTHLTVTITRDNNIITVTNGQDMRQALCPCSRTAKNLESSLRSDPMLAFKWMRKPVAMHLDLAYETAMNDW